MLPLIESIRLTFCSLSGTAFDLELNTPNISEDSSDPLLKLLYKFKKQ